MPRGRDFERAAIAGRDIMDQLPTNRQAERQRHRKAIRRGFAHQHQLFGADGNLDRLALRQVLCRARQHRTNGKPDAAIFHDAFKDIGRPDEAIDEGRGWFIVNRNRRAQLLDPAAIHHGDAISDGHRFFLVMRDQNGGQAELALQALDFDLHIKA